MKKTEPNDPAYPVTTEIQLSKNSSTTGPAGGLTKREYFANSAPAKIPNWFMPTFVPPNVCNEPADYYIHRESLIQERYFRWRIHYARMMIDALNGNLYEVLHNQFPVKP